MAEICTRRATPDCAATRPTSPAPSAWMRCEIAGAAFRQNANGVDHQIGALDRTPDGRLIGDRGIQRHHLPHGAHRLEEQRRFRVAHRDAHDEALMRQPLHDIAADEAGTTEYSRYAARCHHRSPAARP